MKKIIIYNLKEKSNKERCKILQVLYGYTDKSNKSQYTYKRKGLLNDLEYKKETESVLYFTNKKDQLMALKILKKLAVKISLSN